MMNSSSPSNKLTPSAEQGQAHAAPQTGARLLEFLVCPATKTTLELSKDRTELISRAARLAYPIRDGVPMLTSDTARELTDDELRS